MCVNKSLAIFARASIRPAVVAVLWVTGSFFLVYSIADLRDTYDAKHRLTTNIRNGVPPPGNGDPPTHWNDMLARVKGFELTGYVFVAIAIGIIALGFVILYRRGAIGGHNP